MKLTEMSFSPFMDWQLGTCNTCGEHENLVDCTGCSGAFCKNCLFQASGVCVKPGFICAFGWCQWLVGLIELYNGGQGVC
jgi:hypothetical protein